MKNYDTIYISTYIKDIVRNIVPDIYHSAGVYDYAWTDAPMTVVLNRRSGEWRTAEEQDDYCFDTEGYFNIDEAIRTANEEHWDPEDLERELANYICRAVYDMDLPDWREDIYDFIAREQDEEVAYDDSDLAGAIRRELDYAEDDEETETAESGINITDEYINDIVRNIMYDIEELGECVWGFDSTNNQTLVIDTETGEWQLAGDNDLYRNETDTDIDLSEAISTATDGACDREDFEQALAHAIRRELERL
ncbi:MULTISPECIES: hypothetical protein [unclassified Adlercreutzia]|uniref:hypothetical protein n=1 Tax=unclassified Adlercreutzia TaxID=2636013 RepID=UPI0013E9E498|nr:MULTISPECIES: hypothetical protein [unclassified Adlercreutzia]